MQKILLVDDEKDIRDTIQTGLTRRGYHVDTSCFPIEALDNYRNNFYDLIILDIKMPEMNGYELYQEIKKKDPKVKINFLTALETVDLPLSLLATGYPNVIQKPITVPKLIEIIEKQTTKSNI